MSERTSGCSTQPSGSVDLPQGELVFAPVRRAYSKVACADGEVRTRYEDLPGIGPESFVTVYPFMILELQLSGNDLIAYAAAYAFAREHANRVSRGFIADIANCNKRSVCRSLDKLETGGYIKRLDGSDVAVTDLGVLREAAKRDSAPEKKGSAAMRYLPLDPMQPRCYEGMRIGPDYGFEIKGWMTAELGLKGNALLVYAYVSEFSKNGTGGYEGDGFVDFSFDYVADAVACSRRTVSTVIGDLVDSGYLERRNTYLKNGGQHARLRTVPLDNLRAAAAEAGRGQGSSATRKTVTKLQDPGDKIAGPGVTELQDPGDKIAGPPVTELHDGMTELQDPGDKIAPRTIKGTDKKTVKGTEKETSNRTSAQAGSGSTGGRTGGPSANPFLDSLPEPIREAMLKLDELTLNRNDIARCPALLAQLVDEGYGPDELVAAWSAHPARRGREPRFSPNLAHWLSGTDGKGDPLYDCARSAVAAMRAREAGKDRSAVGAGPDYGSRIGAAEAEYAESVRRCEAVLAAGGQLSPLQQRILEREGRACG